IKTTRQFGPAGQPERQIYFATAQKAPGFLTFIARVRGTTDAYLPVLRDAIRQVDPRIPVYDVRTLDQRLSDALARPRFYTTAIAFLAGFAVLLAVIGIYGVAAYSVAQRTKEIGVRIAVGASPRVVRAMLLRQNTRPVAIGMLAGVVGAAGLGKFLGYLMPAADSVDPWICAAAAIVLAAIAAGAVWTATVRVARIDPMNALRAD
ncbi:MAG: FtsX-like permease family protein, partial [Bryobacteraceae bacterium]